MQPAKWAKAAGINDYRPLSRARGTGDTVPGACAPGSMLSPASQAQQSNQTKFPTFEAKTGLDHDAA